MKFIRTVLGDIAPAALGVCDAHAHVIIDPSFTTENEPDFLIDDVARTVTELKEFHAHGGRALIDSMPGGGGRNALKLAEVSARSDVHIVAPTGVHLAKYYPPGHPVLATGVEALTAMMVAEIETGIDDGNGRLPHRAGVIKVAGGRDRLSAFERNIFIAAARAHRLTGCPILTHTEQGTAVDEQIELLGGNGADLSRVTLSHTDRNPDATLHRRWLKTGVNLEYDHHFRWRDRTPNPTANLVRDLIAQFPHQIMVGMDAARRSYWHSYGGSPGLAYLLKELPALLQLPRDLAENVYVKNPASAFCFVLPEKA